MSNLLSMAALPVYLASLVLLALKGSLFSPRPAVIACQILGVALAVWARTIFPKGSFRVLARPAGPTVLRTGPYGIIRHPMYACALLILWAGVAAHLSPGNVGIGLVASALVLGKIVVEERLLKAAYPEYAEYARTTKALVPFVI